MQRSSRTPSTAADARVSGKQPSQAYTTAPMMGAHQGDVNVEQQQVNGRKRQRLAVADGDGIQQETDLVSMLRQQIKHEQNHNRYLSFHVYEANRHLQHEREKNKRLLEDLQFANWTLAKVEEDKLAAAFKWLDEVQALEKQLKVSTQQLQHAQEQVQQKQQLCAALQQQSTALQQQRNALRERKRDLSQGLLFCKGLVQLGLVKNTQLACLNSTNLEMIRILQQQLEEAQQQLQQLQLQLHAAQVNKQHIKQEVSRQSKHQPCPDLADSDNDSVATCYEQPSSPSFAATTAEPVVAKPAIQKVCRRNTARAPKNGDRQSTASVTRQPAKKQRLVGANESDPSVPNLADLPDCFLASLANQLGGQDWLNYVATSRSLAKAALTGLKLASKPLLTLRVSSRTKCLGLYQLLSWMQHIRLEFKDYCCLANITSYRNRPQAKLVAVEEIRMQKPSMLEALPTLESYFPEARTLNLQFELKKEHLDAVLATSVVSTLKVAKIGMFKCTYPTSQPHASTQVLKLEMADDTSTAGYYFKHTHELEDVEPPTCEYAPWNMVEAMDAE